MNEQTRPAATFELFHLTPSLVAVGSVLRPGSYGRAIRFMGCQHPHYFYELDLENYRVSNCPNLPSRLNSVFTFASKIEAEAYRRTEPLYRHHSLYKVAISDDNTPIHHTPISYRNTGYSAKDPEWAKPYWNPGTRKISSSSGTVCSSDIDDLGFWEVLIGGDVEVIEIIDDGYPILISPQ